MRHRRTRRTVSFLITAILLFQMIAQTVTATPAPVDDRTLEVAPGNDAFQRTWERTDQPVANGQANRTWMWGPEAFSEMLEEEYTESLGKTRTVQYFDKSRMEITDPGADQNSIWYVTNGLLVVELLTGQMQVGNNDFTTRFPAAVNVAGDSDDETGPTYATFSMLLGHDALTEGTVITQRVNRDGDVTEDPALAGNNVLATRYAADTGHTVAAPFWEFMNSTGPVYEAGAISNAALFQNPFYATGFPVAEAYWAEVKVAGTYRDVLMQCFERRCLTFTPDNPEGWQVEAGNVGQHYYTWRYETEEPEEVYPIAYIEGIDDGTINNRWINIMNSDGSDQRSLTLDDEITSVSAISLSPDGQTIAFLAWVRIDSEQSQRHLYTINIDGSDLNRVTQHTDGFWPINLSWSPDGEHIAILVAEEELDGQHINIYLISRDGTSMEWVTGGREVIFTVTWSPDGTTLLFSSNRDCTSGFVSCIWTIQIGETDRTKILTSLADNIVAMDWSPDGTEIVYSTWHGSDQYEIRITEADGNNDRLLLDTKGAIAIYPSWSPTGQKIYFADNRSGSYDIYVVNQNGTNEQRLTDGVNEEFNPSPPSR